MASPEIVSYIKQQAEAGYGKEQIYQALLKAGWSREQVNEAIYEIMGKRPPEGAEGAHPGKLPGQAAKPELVRYAREQMNAGFRKAQIQDALLSAGWYREEIDAAFYEIASQVYERPEPPGFQVAQSGAKPPETLPGSPGFFWKLRNVLFHPGRFFEAVKPEKGAKKALAFFGMVLFLNFIIMLAALLFSSALMSSFAQNEFLSYFQSLVLLFFVINMLDPLNLLITYVIVLAITLIGAAIIHLFVWMLRGSKGFYQTYKALMYASAPLIFLWVVFPLIFLQSALMLDLTIASYSLSALLPAILMVVLPVWILVIAVKGLSRLHGISALKAFAALVVIPFIIAAVISFAAYMLLTSYFIGIFGPLLPSGQSAGFEIGILDWQYGSDGAFSIVFRNMDSDPVSINSVTANCGPQGSLIALQTSYPTNLEPGSSISYSTGSEKCAPREFGESYSFDIAVKYLDKNNIVQTSSRTLAA